MTYIELKEYFESNPKAKKELLKQQMKDPKIMFRVRIWPYIPEDLKAYCQTIKENHYLEVYGFPVSYDYPLDDEVEEYIDKMATLEKSVIAPHKIETNYLGGRKNKLVAF